MGNIRQGIAEITLLLKQIIRLLCQTPKKLLHLVSQDSQLALLVACEVQIAVSVSAYEPCLDDSVCPVFVCFVWGQDLLYSLGGLELLL